MHIHDFPRAKGPGKRGHIVADTLLPTQMFPRLPARATFVADTNFVSETQKMFLILITNILCPQQMFPSLRSMETQHSFCVPRVCAPKKHHEKQCVRNNVSSFARALARHLLDSDRDNFRRTDRLNFQSLEKIPNFRMCILYVKQEIHIH